MRERDIEAEKVDKAASKPRSPFGNLGDLFGGGRV